MSALHGALNADGLRPERQDPQRNRSPRVSRIAHPRVLGGLVGETVRVLGLADEEDCEHDMFVTVRWKQSELAVPLAQLQPNRTDEDTRQAVEDWHYLVARGYLF